MTAAVALAILPVDGPINNEQVQGALVGNILSGVDSRHNAAVVPL